jgi:lipopolysaccharide export system permease protein
MKILNRYILKEHLGPFVFSLVALTSLMLLQYIARQFGNLVGQGIGWDVILEFFLLSIPFTVAMTLPMAVLVAVLYAFSRLSSENEITALKAGGVSTRSLMHTVLIGAAFLSLFMVVFNDQVMPRMNHRLATLQLNIALTKPTFALREQVINEVQPERLFLRAASIDPATSKMTDVTIDDLTDQQRRRTIIADSGHIAMAANHRDVVMTLYSGYVVSMPTDRQGRLEGQLDRLYFGTQLIRMRDVANQFQQTDAEDTMKGSREMTVCEMQVQYQRAWVDYDRARASLDEALWRANGSKGPMPMAWTTRRVSGIGGRYCGLLKGIVHAVERARKPKPDSLRAASAGGDVALQDRQMGQAVSANVDVTIQKAELEGARRTRDNYGVEIHKKFSLAAACLVLAFIGGPLALRFPRGGIGLVIGFSFGIFALYYVGLIAGQTLAEKGYITPAIAMWAINLVFALAGFVLYARMGHEPSSARGGDFREWIYLTRLRLSKKSPLDPTAA